MATTSSLSECWSTWTSSSLRRTSTETSHQGRSTGATGSSIGNVVRVTVVTLLHPTTCGTGVTTMTTNVAATATREVGGLECSRAFPAPPPGTGSIIGPSRATGAGRTSLPRMRDAIDLLLLPHPPWLCEFHHTTSTPAQAPCMSLQGCDVCAGSEGARV